MNLETYNPNVNKYIKYYTDQASGKNKTKKTMQIGGTSMGPRRKNKQYYVISPSEQVVNQAEALMEDPQHVKKSVKIPVKRIGKRKRVIKKAGSRRVKTKTQLG